MNNPAFKKVPQFYKPEQQAAHRVAYLLFKGHGHKIEKEDEEQHTICDGHNM